MLLSVAVCTRNRAAELQRLLESLVACALPSHEDWEVIVVDNGSLDRTASVIADFRDVLPLRAVHEPTPGLACARNAAVHALRASYVLWTDDDCVVDAQWLVAYANAVRQWPEAALFGGPIVPRFEGSPPEWLVRVAGRVGTAFAARNLGSHPVELSIRDDRVPFGANYAVRTVEQRKHLYDQRLGRGAGIAVGEESELLEGLLRDGASGRWVPEARVTHCIPSGRQRLAYLRDYYAGDGAYEEWRRQMRRADAVSDAGADVTQVALVKRMVVSELRYQCLRLFVPPEVWINDLIAASVARGRLRGRRTMR